MNEFNLYYRMISGDLRPHLNEDGIAEGETKLEKEFFSAEVIVDENFPYNLPKHFPLLSSVVRDGDKLNLTFDDTISPPQVIVSLMPNEKEEDLINLDIPPPPNRKADLYLQVIEAEYERIKKALLDFLNKAEDVQSVSFYAVQNIQLAKKIAKEAYKLKRKLNAKEDDEYEDANIYIIEAVKKHIVYIILDIQELFSPFTSIPPQDEGQLGDELFDGHHSKMQVRVRSLGEKLDDIHLARLLKDIDENATPIQLRDFFVEKLISHKKHIVDSKGKKGYITGHDYNLTEIYLDQIAKLSEEIYQSKIYSSENLDLLAKYENALNIITKLRLDTDSIEYMALMRTDFFQKMQIQLDTWKELITISYTAPVKENIFKDLQSVLITVQSRKNLGLKEDQWNDYICDLLRMQKYYVADQSRSGSSGAIDKSRNESGELDITIRDFSNNGIVKTIIETVKIKSCGQRETIVKRHIEKLLNRYDTSGNEESFIIILSYAKTFSKLWDKYKSYISEHVFQNHVDMRELEPISNKAELKIGYNKFERNGVKARLYHLFLNMNND